MPTETIAHTPGLLDLVITDTRSVDQAIDAAREASLAQADPDDPPLITVYVDTPTGASAADRARLAAGLGALVDELPATHVVAHLDERPTMGAPLPLEGGRHDLRLAVARRALARIASHLMHADDLPLEQRVQAAIQVVAAMGQMTTEEGPAAAVDEAGTIGWSLGDHAVVAAARRFAGLPDTVHRTDQEPLDHGIAPFLARSLGLARNLPDADPSREERFQAVDRRMTRVSFPRVEGLPDTDPDLHRLLYLLAGRVLETLQRTASTSEVRADEVLWQVPDDAPMQYVANVGTYLRATVADLDADLFFRDAAERLALVFDTLGLACMGLHIGPDARQRTFVRPIVATLLEWALSEISLGFGLLEDGAYDEQWAPRALPFWPFLAELPSADEEARARAAIDDATARLQALVHTDPLPEDTAETLDAIRRTALLHGTHPSTRDAARDLDSALDTWLLRAAVTSGADPEDWMQASRRLALAELPSARTLLGRPPQGSSPWWKFWA